MVRPRVRRWLRFGVSTMLVAALLRFIPARELASALAQVPLHVLIFALVVLLSGHVAAAMKWRLLQGGNTGLSVSSALRAHFYGVLANLWLPGVVGGDLVRAGAVARQTGRPALVVLASLVDRIVDSAGLLLLTAFGLLLVGGGSRSGWQLVMVGLAAGIVASVVLFAGYRFAKARGTSRRYAPLVEACDLMLQRPGLVGAAFVISLCVQTAFILVNVQLGRAVGMTAPVSAWFMAWPLAKLAALIPISAAGLGVREAALIALMRPFGDPAGKVMAAGLLWQAVFIIGGVVGWGGFFLFQKQADLRDRALPSSSIAKQSWPTS